MPALPAAYSLQDTEDPSDNRDFKLQSTEQPADISGDCSVQSTAEKKVYHTVTEILLTPPPSPPTTCRKSADVLQNTEAVTSHQAESSNYKEISLQQIVSMKNKEVSSQRPKDSLQTGAVRNIRVTPIKQQVRPLCPAIKNPVEKQTAVLTQTAEKQTAVLKLTGTKQNGQKAAGERFSEKQVSSESKNPFLEGGESEARSAGRAGADRAGAGRTPEPAATGKNAGEVHGGGNAGNAGGSLGKPGEPGRTEEKKSLEREMPERKKEVGEKKRKAPQPPQVGERRVGGGQVVRCRVLQGKERSPGLASKDVDQTRSQDSTFQNLDKVLSKNGPSQGQAGSQGQERTGLSFLPGKLERKVRSVASRQLSSKTVTQVR